MTYYISYNCFSILAMNGKNEKSIEAQGYFALLQKYMYLNS